MPESQRFWLVGGAFFVGAFLALHTRRRFRRWRMLRRFQRGAEAEREALHLARRAGYRVLGAQVTGTFDIRTDDRITTVTVRADMLLERRGRTFVAEVKSGKVAPDPTSCATRRQLLEYHHVFDADGVLLFDMTARRIRTIDFGLSKNRDGRLFWAILGGAAGMGLEAAFGWMAEALGIVASLY